MQTRTDLPELADLLPTADVVDVKTVTGSVTLREFTAGSLSYKTGWIKGLWAVRTMLAKALGLKSAETPAETRLRPEDISFTPGDPLSFFTVVRGVEQHYLLLEVSDTNLVAHLAIVTDEAFPVREFKVITLVHYRRKLGRLYFEAIRPFHHLVVNSMARAGVRKSAEGRQEGGEVGAVEGAGRDQ